MIPGSFIIDGTSSKDLNSLIQERPVLNTPKRKINFKTVSGKNGQTPFDEEAYENTEMNLLLFTQGETEEEVTYKRESIVWALDHGSYVDFIPYFDPNKVYKAMLSSGPIFSGSGAHINVLPYALSLTIKPFKFLRPDDVISSSSSVTVFNPSYYDSEPTITLYGTGDSTITVNGVPFVIKNIQDFITIDSEIAHAYKNQNGIILPQDDKIFTMDYPMLSKGSNVISWTGTISRVEIQPKWRSLI